MALSRRGVTVWFTGLPRSGKTTLSRLLVERLRDLGVERVELLDGDVVRRTLSADLGYSRADRDENIRRIAAVAERHTRAGAVCVVAAVSPYAAARDAARAEIGDFVEVYCAASAAECAARDTTGLYERAFAGELVGFTGVDDPYEPPARAELVLDTVREPPEPLVERVVETLVAAGYLSPA